MWAPLRSQLMKEVGVYVAFSSSIAFVAGISIGHRKPVEPPKESIHTEVKEPRLTIHSSGIPGERINLGTSGLKAVVLDGSNEYLSDYVKKKFYRLDTEHGKTAEIWMSKDYDGVVYLEGRHG